MFNVFEKPWGLLTLAVVVLLILLMVRRILPEKRHWWQLLLPALLTIAAFGLDGLVQTDLEKINAVIDIAVKAAEQENPDAIEAIVSENYSDSYHRNKRALMLHAKRVLWEPLIEKTIRRMAEMTLSPSKTTAEATFTVRIVFDKRSYIYKSYRQRMLVKMKVDLQKEQDKWLISQAELLEINMQPVNWQYVR
ncbi:MAG: hypothetical protein ACYS8I_15895 [Planctomycetota bacterium]|jgi:hypothetical protein